MEDPFGTAGLRDAVLVAWASSPTRFREDANAEEDLRLGGYADAWFVELAQNAADAAGTGGRLRLSVDDGELRIANTGAPLDAAGVTALASLRASAKRDDPGAVGRFGVGFAAVLPLSDAPRVVSSTGAVAFSAARTAAAVALLPGPAAELARRGTPPVLRLAWPSDERPPSGYTTEVRLPLRADVDGEKLLAHARTAAPDLLLALPGLAEIDVAGTVARRVERPGGVEIGGRRWRVARRAGELAVIDDAAEQRDRPQWTVTWALPLDGPLGADVAHAPTATAEGLALPARLIATLPLEPDRRRVRPGAVTDALVGEAAAAYVDLVRVTPPDERLALVPEPGFPRSVLDGQLRDAIVAALRSAIWLPAPRADTGLPVREGEGGPREPAPRRVGDAGASSGFPVTDGVGAPRELAPARAEWLDLPGVDDRLPRLLAAAGFDRLAAPPYRPPALTELGATRLRAADVVDRLFGLDQPTTWWAALYDTLAELADTVPGLLDDLRALPVPLADGRAAAGPATVLLPPTGTTLPDLPGLPVAALTHPLLARLGADEAAPATLLGHPALLEAVDRSVDDADAGLDTAPLADAVLALVEQVTQVDPALAALALPVAGGGVARADELILPDAALRPVLAADVPIDVLDGAFAARVPRAALIAVGVLDGFALVLDDDPVGPDHDLDEEERWWDSLHEPPTRLVAVRDLDLVDDDAWPAALALLGADRATREAVTAGAGRSTRDAAGPTGEADVAAGRPAAAASPVPNLAGYTAWWLARHARLAGRPPRHWRLPGATAIAALYDPVLLPAAGPAPASPPGALAVSPPPAGPAAASRPAGPAAALPATDDVLLAAIGVRRDLYVADTRDADDLLARLADPARHPSAALVADAHIALAAAVTDGRVEAIDLVLPEYVRALDGSLAPVDVAAVLDAPWPAAVLPPGELVIGGDPVALADLLDLPLATEIVAGDVEGVGTPVAWAEIGEIVVACHTLGVAVPDGELRRHEALWVRLTRPEQGRRRVPVWRTADGAWHAEDPLRALVGLLAD